MKNILPEQLPYTKLETCAVCGNKDLKTVIDLPELPLTELMSPVAQSNPQRAHLDQMFNFCENCGHGQLQNIISPEILYNDFYAFKTTQSISSSSGNRKFLEKILIEIGSKHFDTIIEIGSNDLFLLKELKDKVDTLIAIDPMLDKNQEEEQIKVIGDFVENVDLEALIGKGSTLFLNSHNLEHLSNPNDLIKQLLNSASDNCMFIFQIPGLDTLVEEQRFEQVFHHHLHYFSQDSFTRLIQQNGGSVIKHDVDRKHWGSLTMTFKKTTEPELPLKPSLTFNYLSNQYKKFKQRMDDLADQLTTDTNSKYAYGAALTLPVVFYHLKIKPEQILGIIDDSPGRQGLFYLNSPVQVIGKNQIKQEFQELTIIISAINNARQLLPSILSMAPDRIMLPLNNF